MAIAAFAVSISSLLAQSTAPRPKFDAFEVATIKPVESDPKGGRFIKMQGANRFVEKDYTLKLLIAAAYDLNPKTISGGPPWLGSDHYDILAVTPGDLQPTHDEQMSKGTIHLYKLYGLMPIGDTPRTSAIRNHSLSEMSIAKRVHSPAGPSTRGNAARDDR